MQQHSGSFREQATFNHVKGDIFGEFKFGDGFLIGQRSISPKSVYVYQFTKTNWSRTNAVDHHSTQKLHNF